MSSTGVPHASGTLMFGDNADQGQYTATASYQPYNYGAAPPSPERSCPANNKRSCCHTFWTSVFSMQNWFFVAFNLFLMFSFGLFASIWTMTTFATSLGILIFFPIGPMFFMMSALSWKFLGNIEAFVQLYISGNDRGYALDPVCGEPISVNTGEHGFCSCVGIWATFKAIVLERQVWKHAAYFMFIKLPMVVFNFVWTVVWVVVPLALILNFVVVLTCHECQRSGDWGQYESLKWIVNTPRGSAVTVPLGFVLLTFGLYTVRKFTLASAHLALYVLAPPAGRQNNRDSAPLLIAVHDSSRY